MVPGEDNVFAQLGLLGRSQKAVPQALTRRILELLTYLAKHQTNMAREMLTLRVPTPEEQVQLIEREPVSHIAVCSTVEQGQFSQPRLVGSHVPMLLILTMQCARSVSKTGG